MKTIQLLLQFHGEEGTVMANRALEMTEDELRAVTRHLSAIRIADVEDVAVRPMKNLHDTCRDMCRLITCS